MVQPKFEEFTDPRSDNLLWVRGCPIISWNDSQTPEDLGVNVCACI